MFAMGGGKALKALNMQSRGGPGAEHDGDPGGVVFQSSRILSTDRGGIRLSFHQSTELTENIKIKIKF